ncbi:helix-turn-helix domain-containing protein [Ancylobacter lacus]|uniref:helix-turn-helix domain-containing protein n=1 Tax=Ancylobacter lacus TaxID=2579970 RepID=UPI001BCC1532|nr:helix-turn-helix domain-containing protein [Ancylobacter lacus]MBS7540151.1 AraC family transcriptional regulator [Ancylobacter lacus]
MIFVPLPFVVSLLLLLLLARSARGGGGAGRHHVLFLALLAGYALQSVLVGLNWGYGMRVVLPVQAVTASLLAPLAFLAFRSLTEPETAGPAGGPAVWRWRDLLHLPAPLAVAGLFLVDTGPVGPAIVALFLGYGLALLWLARLGPDGLVAARLDGAVRSYRALVVTGGALIASALMDVAISLDLDLAGGRHAPAVVTLGNVLALLLLGAAAAAAESGAAEEAMAEAEAAPGAGTLAPAASAEAPAAAPAGEDHALAAAADALMLRTRLYADGELNLGRLARRLGRPARQVSQAINRVHGLSVSHFVNGYRVREACRLLETTDLPVTRVMLEAGFLTKSNFNRAFQRVTGASPSAWRQKARG